VSASLRQRLGGHGPALIGTFLMIPRVEIIELIGLAGFDLVVLDCEHGPFGVEALPPLVAAARAAQLACVVRVPDSRAQTIGAALDVGADGVLVPQAQTAAAAADVVAAARFAPEGSRGANPYVRAADYSADGKFFATANDEAACLAMVESPEGVAALDEILSVAGLDAVFIGPVDLSAALGVPGETESVVVVEMVREIIDRGRARGVAASVFASTTDAAVRWLALGVRLVVLSVDTGLILEGFTRPLSDLRVRTDQLARARPAAN
jgi:2-keto-3-deoxy-L-rhamnonate aldolase RhmA